MGDWPIRFAVRVAALAGVATLGGCSGSERSADYFAAHEGEARQLAAACIDGTARGAECDNAVAGLRKANGARAYKKSEFPVRGGRQF